MSFKDMVKSDIHRVFLSPKGFGEYHTVRYDDVTYEHIPLVLNAPTQAERSTDVNDHVQKIYTVTQIMHCDIDDIGHHLPEQGSRIEISDNSPYDPGDPDWNHYNDRGLYFHCYYILQSNVEVGKVRLLLSALDE